MQRTFRLPRKLYLDVAVNSTNTLNHVVFTSWNTNVSSAQFGLPNNNVVVRSLSNQSSPEVLTMRYLSALLLLLAVATAAGPQTSRREQEARRDAELYALGQVGSCD